MVCDHLLIDKLFSCFIYPSRCFHSCILFDKGIICCVYRLEGSCNHVAALLFALVDVTEHKRKGIHASTSQTCLWRQPRKRRLSPVKAHILTVKSAKVTQNQFPEAGLNIQQFMDRLADCAPEAGCYVNYSAADHVLPRRDTKPSLPARPVQELYFADYVDLKSEMSHNIFLDFAAKCSMSPEDRCQSEEATRDQANSPLWFEVRTSSH